MKKEEGHQVKTMENERNPATAPNLAGGTGVGYSRFKYLPSAEKGFPGFFRLICIPFESLNIRNLSAGFIFDLHPSRIHCHSAAPEPLPAPARTREDLHDKEIR